MKGIDAFKRRAGSVKKVMDATPQTAKRILTEYAVTKWKPLAQAIAPKDTGEFAELLDYEVDDRQLRLLGRANHSKTVEEGSYNHEAQPTIKPAFEQTRPEIGKMMRAELKGQMGK